MGERGPRPAPTALKMVRGDRPSRIAQAEPEAPVSPEPPPAPDDLGEEAAEVWARHAPMLHAQAVLTEWDLEALARFCEAVVMARHAYRSLLEDGLSIPGDAGGQVRNPAAATWQAAANAVRQFAQEFGMTPSARSRISAAPRKPATDEAEAAAVLS